MGNKRHLRIMRLFTNGPLVNVVAVCPANKGFHLFPHKNLTLRARKRRFRATKLRRIIRGQKRNRRFLRPTTILTVKIIRMGRRMINLCTKRLPTPTIPTDSNRVHHRISQAILRNCFRRMTKACLIHVKRTKIIRRYPRCRSVRFLIVRKQVKLMRMLIARPSRIVRRLLSNYNTTRGDVSNDLYPINVKRSTRRVSGNLLNSFEAKSRQHVNGVRIIPMVRKRMHHPIFEHHRHSERIKRARFLNFLLLNV